MKNSFGNIEKTESEITNMQEAQIFIHKSSNTTNLERHADQYEEQMNAVPSYNNSKDCAFGEVVAPSASDL